MGEAAQLGQEMIAGEPSKLAASSADGCERVGCLV